MNTWIKILSLPLFLSCSLAHAVEAGGVTIGGTRLIYEGSKKEASLNVTNSDVSPYLIQSWAETQNGGADKAPFIVTPPLFRLDANQQNTLRIVRTGGNLPEDRESLFWLNVKSIPAGVKKESGNTLQIAVKSRIKLIYRPQSLLKGSPEKENGKLSWTINGNRLTVNNASAYYMNFQEVKVGGREVKEATYVAPMSSTSFPVPAGTAGNITWKLITDYGGTGPEHGQGH